MWSTSRQMPHLNGPVEAAYSHYAAQVHAYGRSLNATGVVSGRRLHCGLLFMGRREHPVD